MCKESIALSLSINPCFVLQQQNREQSESYQQQLSQQEARVTDLQQQAVDLHQQLAEAQAEAQGELPRPRPCFNIDMSSYQYRKSHCGDQTILQSSYLCIGISYTGKMAFLYWISPQGPISISYKMSYCKISQSLEPEKLGVKILTSHWNLVNGFAAVLPRCMILQF